MSFNTPQYALLLIAVFWLYWFLKTPRARLLLLLIASYVFYGSWDARYLILLAGCTLFQFVVGCWLGDAVDPVRRKWLLALSVAGGLGTLVVFKYLGFFTGEIARTLAALGLDWAWPRLHVLLPVGISFYTFHTLSYTIDLYRRKIEPTRDLLQWAVFVAFFPLLVAGPILRASQFLPQLEGLREYQHGSAMDGVHRIVRGLLKKAVFADLLAAMLVDPVFARPLSYGNLALLLAVYGYAIQIYSDFSGYSDIAIGSAKVLGLQIPENFDHPYLATNLREFWQRWHISLSTWLRDYLYIPLGGSRISPGRTQLNLALTMLLGGIWHGANWTFVIWGALHGGMLALNRHLQRRAEGRPGPPTPERGLWLRRFGTFHLVCLGWVFFRAANLESAYQMLRLLVTPHSGASAGHVGPFLLLCGLALHFGHGPWKDALAGAFVRLPAPAQALLVWSGVCIAAYASGVAKPFIYFQF